MSLITPESQRTQLINQWKAESSLWTTYINELLTWEEASCAGSKKTISGLPFIHDMKPEVEKAYKVKQVLEARNSNGKEQKTLSDLSYDSIYQIFKMISVTDVYNCRLLDRKIYGITRDFKMRGELYVILYEQKIRTRVQDKFGKYGGPIQINNINELWRFSGRTIEHLLITFTVLTKKYCTHLLELIKKYNIKVRDLSIWNSHLMTPGIATDLAYLVIKALQPQTIVINEPEKEIVAKIVKDSEMMERLKAFLVPYSSFLVAQKLIPCPLPRYFVEHAHKSCYLLVEFISCVKNTEFLELYDRYPVLSNEKFRHRTEYPTDRHPPLI